jgi:hypothetical protein
MKFPGPRDAAPRFLLTGFLSRSRCILHGDRARSIAPREMHFRLPCGLPGIQEKSTNERSTQWI